MNRRETGAGGLQTGYGRTGDKAPSGGKLEKGLGVFKERQLGLWQVECLGWVQAAPGPVPQHRTVKGPWEGLCQDRGRRDRHVTGQVLGLPCLLFVHFESPAELVFIL